MRKRKIKIGHAFAEHIHSERNFFLRSRGARYKEVVVKMRSRILPISIALAVLLLIGKLFFLQIIQGYHYRIISDTNRFREVLVHAPRGIVMDSRGNPLVLNTPGFREIKNGKAVFFSSQEALNALSKGDPHIEVDSLRNYTDGEIFGQIIGYIGEISENQLKNPAFSGYNPGDIIGQMGIEATYENKLKGTDGKRVVEVDAFGKITKTMGQTDPIPGEDISLTIDSELQKKVFTAMKGVVRGAAIVSSPTGEIYALVSKPSFDPNLFTMGKTYIPPAQDTYTSISAVLSDTVNKPLLNRAISGAYPPGSTFKLVAASAALEDRVIDQNFTVTDNGVLKLGDFSFANWYYTQYGKTEGVVDIEKAIQRSNDIYFYTLGAKLGVDRLSAFAREFGLGEKLGIDLPGEAKGLVPTKEWKRKTVGEDWFTGDDYHYGIGQGYLLTTPLQVNAWTQEIANRGTLYLPHLLKEPPLVKHKGLLSEKNYELVRDGMIKACDPGGVAWPLFNFSVKNPKLSVDNLNITKSASEGADMRHVVLACKTGTAEHGDTAKTQPHAWITIFAPAYHPQVIITVLAEDSGEGSNVAGPIAKDILTSWFER